MAAVSWASQCAELEGDDGPVRENGLQIVHYLSAVFGHQSFPACRNGNMEAQDHDNAEWSVSPCALL